MVSSGPRGATVLMKTFLASSGRSVTVAEFPAATTAFHLHVGSSDPPSALSLAPNDAGNAISTAESALVVAAFNGGFKRGDRAGGMIVDGVTVSPMLDGKATAMIDENGALSVGVWGQSTMTPTTQVVDARQNLQLLVENGAPTSAARANPLTYWGASVSGPVTARSGLGVDHSGNVFFVAVVKAVPLDLAEALVSVGAVTGMQLDINPFWITLGTASSPGALLTSGIPGQQHSASIFAHGWERDFVTVLAKPSLACRLVFPAPPGVAAPDPPRTACVPNALTLPEGS